MVRTLSVVRATALALLVFAMTAHTARAAATSTTDTFHGAFEGVQVTNPCNGETVLFSGQTTIVAHTTEIAGQLFVSASQSEVTGTGTDSSGNTYRFNSHNGVVGASTVEGAYVLTFEGFNTVITQGPGLNFVTHVTSTTVFTPSGQVTQVLFDDARCVGGRLSA